MKLYATVTSERATKGQGGNDYLDINITLGNAKEKVNAGSVHIVEISPNVFALYYQYMASTKLIRQINTRGSVFEEKGNKQKGEIIACPQHNTVEGGYCRACGKRD